MIRHICVINEMHQFELYVINLIRNDILVTDRDTGNCKYIFIMLLSTQN